MEYPKISNCEQSSETIDDVEKNNTINYVDSQTIEMVSRIPERIYISNSETGNSVFVNKHFKKGELIYKGKYNLIEDKEFSIKMNLIKNHDQTKKETFILEKNVHAVSIGNNKRKLFFFDSFMNHSCDPNTFTFYYINEHYDVFAARDINSDEELTCDYLNFEYDLRDKNILKCECKSNNCLERIVGFKFLTNDQKKSRLNIITKDVFNSWVEEYKYKDGDTVESVFVDNLKLPVGIVITNSDSLVATKSFYSGDILFEGESKNINEKTIVIAVTENGRKWMDHEINSDLSRNYHELTSFIKHSDDANVLIKLTSNYLYQVIAIKNINENEELLSKNN